VASDHSLDFEEGAKNLRRIVNKLWDLFFDVGEFCHVSRIEASAQKKKWVSLFDAFCNGGFGGKKGRERLLGLVLFKMFTGSPYFMVVVRCAFHHRNMKVIRGVSLSERGTCRGGDRRRRTSRGRAQNSKECGERQNGKITWVEPSIDNDGHVLEITARGRLSGEERLLRQAEDARNLEGNRDQNQKL